MRTGAGRAARLTAGVVAAPALMIVGVPAPAEATIVQQSNVKLLAASGTLAVRSGAYARVDAYLSTREPLSSRGDSKPNPVGTVRMTFPSGTALNTVATPGCKLRPASSPAQLRAGCAASQVGFGWALLSNLGSSPLSQLAGSPPDCPAGDAAQYARTYASAAPACVPRGLIWVKVRAYQGSGDGTRVVSRRAIVFANDNSVAALSFPGTVSSTTLAVTLPALGGFGSQAGEFPFGIVLTDFRLVINRTNYLRMGTCPGGHRFTVTTKTVYSQLVGESGPAPGAQSIATKSNCRP